MKTCTKCKQEKEYECFSKSSKAKDGLQYRCRECNKEYHYANAERIAIRKRVYQQKNKLEIAIKKHAYYTANKEAIAAKQKERNKKNKEQRANYHRAYYLENRELILKRSEKYARENKEHKKRYTKEYRQLNADKICKRLQTYYYKNKEKIYKYQVKYRQENREKIRSYYCEYIKNRAKNDVHFKLRQVLSGHIYKSLKGNQKAAPTRELVGCTAQELKEHIEKQFTEGMTWDNWTHDGWHIDHIKPCAAFDLTDPEQQKQCYHYTNLQPLWAVENIKKGAKWGGIDYRGNTNSEATEEAKEEQEEAEAIPFS